MDENPYKSPVSSEKEPMNRHHLRDLIVMTVIAVGVFMTLSAASITFLEFKGDLPLWPSPFARSAAAAYAIIGCAIVWKSIAWLRRQVPKN